MTDDTRRVGDKVSRRDTGEATHLGERGETKVSAKERGRLIRVLLNGQESKGQLEITTVHLEKLLDELEKRRGYTSLRDVTEECYDDLGALLSLENEVHEVKSVNGVAYCTLNQERVTDFFGWIDTWPVAKNVHMVATKEEIRKTHVSPIDHMIMMDKQPTKTMVAQQALTRDLLNGTRLIEDGELPPYLSVDAWPFNGEPPGGKYREPENMEKIGDSVLKNTTVKAVLSRVLNTIASGDPVGRLCLKLIEKMGGRWVRFENEAYDLLDIPGGHVMCTASSAEEDITGVYVFRLPDDDTARLLTVVYQLGSGYFGQGHSDWHEKMNTDVSIFNALRALARLPQNADTLETEIYGAFGPDRLERNREERIRHHREGTRWYSGQQLRGAAGGKAAGVAYREAQTRADADPTNAEAVAEAERLRKGKVDAGKAAGVAYWEAQTCADADPTNAEAVAEAERLRKGKAAAGVAYREAQTRADADPTNAEAVAKAERLRKGKADAGAASGVAYREAQTRADADSKNAEVVVGAERLRKGKVDGGTAGGLASWIKRLEKLGPLTHACSGCRKWGMAGKECVRCPKSGGCYRVCLACQKKSINNLNMSCRHHKLISM